MTHTNLYPQELVSNLLEIVLPVVNDKIRERICFEIIELFRDHGMAHFETLVGEWPEFDRALQHSFDLDIREDESP